jgi:membrane-bound serine protease (ClpP class)
MQQINLDFTSTIIAVSIILGSFLVFALYKVLQAAKKKIAIPEFAGQIAVAIDKIDPEKEGFVRFRGEYWKAQSKTAITSGQKVIILYRNGLILTVEPLNKQN